MERLWFPWPSPDNQTQALLVTRYGTPPAGLATYINAGGIVISEFSISDEVFGAVFGAVPQSSNQGSCTDVAPTVYQYNATDPMWVSVGWTATNLGDSGCGFDVSAFPGITPLAGWSAPTVSIGYRNSGAGRVWLADFDWQDNSTTGAPYAYTNKIMGYMITHRR